MDKERLTTGETPKTEAPTQTSDDASDSGPNGGVLRTLNAKMKGLIAQKWFFPAIYLGAAALILSFIFWYQGTKQYSYDKEQGLPTVETREPGTTLVVPEDESVTTSKEKTLIWPVAEAAGARIVRPFYDDAASAEEKARSLVEFASSYYPNTGVDLSIDGKTPFDVVAALDGTVTRAEVDPVAGGVVWVDHGDGMVTMYESLGSISVHEGDAVKQGTSLGAAGTSPVGKDLGVHLHFEVHKDGEPVNPTAVLPSMN